jgi:hypothetical protein
MAFKSAWSRGLCYGGIFGGGIALIPVSVAIFSEAPVAGIAFGGGMIALIWGSLGFLAGYASHAEQRADPVGIALPSAEYSLFRRLLYRFVAGLLLSYIAGAIVSLLAAVLFFTWTTSLPAPADQAGREAERLMFFVAFCGLVGAETGAVAGCWIGAILVRGNVLGPIAKAAFVTAIIGALLGGWFGTLIGVVWFNARGFEETGAIVAAVGGGVAGIAAAVITRLGIFRG